MKKVLFITSYASPYRVEFLDELSRYCDVTVAYSERVEVQKHRDQAWFVQPEGRFRSVQLGKRVMAVKGRSLCLGVLDLLREPFDHILLCGYSIPTQMLAIEYLRARKRPYIMEVDGGRIREDSPALLRFKRHLIRGAAAYFGTGEATTDYLCYYGADRRKVYTYPFTSLWERDICAAPATAEEKQTLRRELGIPEKRVVLAVGRVDYLKGPDVLLGAAQSLPADTGIYLVGGEPTEELKQQAEDLSGVHFVGFRKKEELAKYYRTADVLAMPTRTDVWGLVINEAMAAGLPVVSSDACVAALELVKNGENGYIVPCGDPGKLAEKLNAVLNADLSKMGQASLDRIRPYTYENMAKVHMELFESLEKSN